MITQYTRIVVDSATGNIAHCISQDFPFVDGWQPINDPSITPIIYDFEIDMDYPDSDFGIGVNQEMLRAGKIIDNFEVVNGQPRLKASADTEVSSKVMRLSHVKPIEEASIKLEMVAFIRAALDSGGSSEEELLATMRDKDPLTPVKIADLRMMKIIRLKKALAIK